MSTQEQRAALPFTEAERLFQGPPYIYTSGTVPVKERDADYIFYQTWTDARVEQRNADLVWIHGLNDYGGRSVPYFGTWLSAGLRVVAIDLPAHGRSAGTHSFVTDIYAFPRVIREAISFITKYDNPSPPDLQEKRRVFVGGGSLGGWASLEYGLNPNENVAGIIAWCPMIYSVGESTPNIFIQYIAKILINLGFGWLPLAAANRGKASTPENEALFMNDPLTYHGNMRVATGLQLLSGMYHLRANMNAFRMPVFLAHGKLDRVTEWQGSEEFYALCGSRDRDLKLYENMQHDIMREPDVEVVLAETRDWILERLKQA